MSQQLQMNITLQNIIQRGPCYDPCTKQSQNWSGSLIDVLNMAYDETISHPDAAWVMGEFAGERINRTAIATYIRGICQAQAGGRFDRNGLWVPNHINARDQKSISTAIEFSSGGSSLKELLAAKAQSRPVCKYICEEICSPFVWEIANEYPDGVSSLTDIYFSLLSEGE